MTERLASLRDEVVNCRACPRLVAWREQVATEKRASFADQEYWGRPVPGFGDPKARLLVLGLAPAAHGANRTGRMFTGDRSGDFLYSALYRAGFASQGESTHRHDGLELFDCYVTAVVRCAPPGNKPTPEERDNCSGYLRTELEIVPARVVLALGSFAWEAALRLLGPPPPPRPRFSHGAGVDLGGRIALASYHPSQQNTFTGRLTPEMLDEVLAEAKAILSPRGQA